MVRDIRNDMTRDKRTVYVTVTEYILTRTSVNSERPNDPMIIKERKGIPKRRNLLLLAKICTLNSKGCIARA